MAARLESFRTRLEQYLTCEAAILDGAQEYWIANRKLVRADLTEISKMIAYLEKEVATEERKEAGGGRNRVFGVIPRDF